MKNKWFWDLFLLNRKNLRQILKSYDYVNQNVFDVEKYAINEIKRRVREFVDRPDIQVVPNSTYKGQNLPFNIHNHRWLAIKFTLFMAIPFSLPFLIVRYHLLKASGGHKPKPPNFDNFDPFLYTNVYI